jgi:2-iminobutanoate/2-iminopropanoate deaminase
MTDAEAITRHMVSGAPDPVAPFSHAVGFKDLLFVTGQIPQDPRTHAVTGGTMAEQTHRVMKNLAIVLAGLGRGFGHVLAARVFITDFSKYEEMNEAYRSYFEPGKLPARTCIGVTGLAGGVDVEIDLVVARGGGER